MQTFLWLWSYAKLRVISNVDFPLTVALRKINSNEVGVREKLSKEKVRSCDINKSNCGMHRFHKWSRS